MQQQRPQPPLKSEIESMSEEQQSAFKEGMDSLTKEQKAYLGGLMKQNEEELSSLSSDELLSALTSMIDEAKNADDETLQSMQESMQGSMPPPPPPKGENALNSMMSSLSEDQQTTLQESLSELTNEQKMYLGGMLKDSEEELSELSSDELADTLSAMIEEAAAADSSEIAANMPPPPPQGMGQMGGAGGMQGGMGGMQGSMPPPPPPGENAMSSVMDSMSEDEQETFHETMSSLTGEQRMSFGSMLKELEDSFASMSEEEIKETVFSMLDEAQSLTSTSSAVSSLYGSSSTSSLQSSMYSRSFLLNAYA
jgi:TRAP-type C4-dicarboxylate transport system substrate-binding protein